MLKEKNSQVILKKNGRSLIGLDWILYPYNEVEAWLKNIKKEIYINQVFLKSEVNNKF